MTKLNHPVILTIKISIKVLFVWNACLFFCHLCGGFFPCRSESCRSFTFILFLKPQSSSPAMQTPFLLQEKRPSGPLETLIPLIILEFGSKSALHKPTPEPQNKPSAASTNNIAQREKGLIPTVHPGKCSCSDIPTMRRQVQGPYHGLQFVVLRSASLNGETLLYHTVNFW